MGGLLEVGGVFRDCVKRKKKSGLSAPDAEDVCAGYGQHWPAYGFFSTPSKPEPPPMEQPPDGGDGDGNGTPNGGSGNGSGAPAPAGGSSAPLKSRKRRTEGLAGFAGGSYTGGQSRWGGKNLTPHDGYVRSDRNVRTEAHLWATEMRAVGQFPVTNRQEWEVHAERMGFFSPDSKAEGWDYIERVFNKRRDHVVAELREVLEFSGKPYGGYSFVYPNLDQGDPSWPWRTEEAKAVFAAAEKIVRKNPNIDIEELFDLALGKSKISTYELTPEDDALMGMALQWLIMGKDARPEAPRIAVSRNPFGMKGTQQGGDRYVAPRGAP